jgi:hypothetical protein
MLITIKGCHPIEIPESLLLQAKAQKMDGKTSYLNRFATKLKKKGYVNGALSLKMQCLLNLDKVAFDYHSYFDIMAGLGLTARIFEADQMFLNEIDEPCKNVLANNFPFTTENRGATIFGKDIFGDEMLWAASDMIFADWNNFTYKRYQKEYRPVMDTVFACALKYVIINDCTPFFFRYGKRSFDVYTKMTGVPIESTEGYFQYMRCFYKAAYPEWLLTDVEYFRESSFMLLRKTSSDEPLKIHFNSKENLEPGLVTVT